MIFVFIKIKHILLSSFFQIEEFGIPVAWKVDSRIAVLLKTDVRRFAALIQRSFMQRSFVINDNLPLDRIECESDDLSAPIRAFVFII